MKFDIRENSHANITFNGDSRVSVKGNFPYLVKWFCDNEFIGEMLLHGGCWGSYDLKIGNWKIEFWENDAMVNVYNNDLTDAFILLVPKFSTLSPGKLLNSNQLTNLTNRVSLLTAQYGCNIVCFIKNSERYSLPENIVTYKMNDNYNFKMMIEEWII